MDNQLNKFLLHQQVKKSLSIKLGIPSLRAGGLVVRDHRDWRINEKQIEYCWLINVSRSFAGECWLFTIRFNETKFRDIKNPEELLQGIFTIDSNGVIDNYHTESNTQDFRDKIKELSVSDPFSANPGITLDGVIYEYLIFAPNSETRLTLGNPNSKNWKIWEEAVWELGRELAWKSNSRRLKEIFT